MNTNSVLGVTLIAAVTGYAIYRHMNPDEVIIDFWGCKFTCTKHNTQN